MPAMAISRLLLGSWGPSARSRRSIAVRAIRLPASTESVTICTGWAPIELQAAWALAHQAEGAGPPPPKTLQPVHGGVVVMWRQFDAGAAPQPGRGRTPVPRAEASSQRWIAAGRGQRRRLAASTARWRVSPAATSCAPLLKR